MKTFPVEKLVAKAPGGLQGRIEFNPYAELAPCLWYSVHVDFRELPELSETPWLLLDGIVVPSKNWKEFAGPYRAPQRWDNGSILVESAHNPADTHSIEFLNRRGTTFDIRVEVLFDFAFEGVGYENIYATLEFPVQFQGIVFNEPNWSNPDSVKYPSEWRIPAEYSQDSVDELVSRFVNLDTYDKTQDGSHWKYIPKV